MKMKLSRPTTLKIIVGTLIVLTIVGTVIAIALVPAFSPLVAGAGSFLALAVDKDTAKMAINKVLGECLDSNEPEESEEPTRNYTYRWTRTTRHLTKTDSGNSLNETTTQENGTEQGEVEDDRPASPSPRPHP